MAGAGGGLGAAGLWGPGLWEQLSPQPALTLLIFPFPDV